jgi:hypothetical protein
LPLRLHERTSARARRPFVAPLPFDRDDLRNLVRDLLHD